MIQTGILLRLGLASLLFLALTPGSAAAQEVVLTAVKDNTLYEDENGSLSNGAGARIFTGRNGLGEIRRALFAFDVAGALPDGAVIRSASLTLQMTKTTSGTFSVSLHRILADWGEGASDAIAEEGGGVFSEVNDATWIHRFFDTVTWQKPGGDFAALTSASTLVGDLGSYVWGSTPTLVADVALWAESPEQNFGWILIGDEESSRTSKRFDSRNNTNAANRPELRITFEVPTAAESEVVTPAPSLLPAWPNPFFETTRLSFRLDAPRHVRLEAFDIAGRRVALLADAWMQLGWHAVPFSREGLAPGVYVVRLTAGPAPGSQASQTLTRTVIVAGE